MSRHIAVLMGGWSAEREISLRSGRHCAEALEAQGYRVTRIDVGRDIATVLQTLKPDVALNLLHGRPGEDGTIQGILEILSIPYTHSGVLASALAMQKDLAKVMFRAAGIPAPEGLVMSRSDAAKAHALPRPYVIKPVNEGSSVGVRIVRERDNSWREEAAKWPFGEVVLIEKYIAGREITVAVMGDRALGVCEIRSKANVFYDYESKYLDEGSKSVIPADLPKKIAEQVRKLSIEAFKAVDGAGMSRVDFLLSRDTGKLFLNEVNTIPGFTTISMYPKLWAATGVEYPVLLDRLIALALARHSEKQQLRTSLT